mmetsp:Transcript_52750/g.159944  ORF Transcript_52750/g.159944 Transcript_52750/m.159944 type:complete len:558 (+) Transcript_52750:1-1674(+)
MIRSHFGSSHLGSTSSAVQAPQHRVEGMGNLCGKAPAEDGKLAAKNRKRELAKVRDHGEIPMETKAIAQLTDTQGGPQRACNAQLKMMLLSSGLMPGSSSNQKTAYKEMYDQTSGKGILFVMDAKIPCEQFWEMNADPARCNNDEHVAYKREPDIPGGNPVRNEAGELVMKTQADLAEINLGFFCNPPYFVHNTGQFSQGHLSVLCGDDDDVPVYFSYHMYAGEMVKGKPDAKIYLGQGVWKGGRFTARKTSGEEFAESDYEAEWAKYVEEKETPWLKQITGQEFKKVVDSVKTMYSCGGNPFLTVLSLQPDYHTSTGKKTKFPNLYGRAILDAVKSGSAIYLGMSAGSVAMSFALGPLTADSAVFEIEEHNRIHRKLDLGKTGILGEHWLFPPLCQYLGMPYRLLFRPHLGINPETLAFTTTKGAHNVEQVLDHSEHACEHDCFVVLMQDYDYPNGQGDCFQIYKSKARYLTSKSDREVEIPEAAKPALRERLGERLGEWVDEHSKVRVQPPSVDPNGLVIEWDPSQGELLASGGTEAPFHLHLSDQGPLADSPPY